MTITAACTVSAATLNFGSSAGTALIASAVTSSATLSVTCTNGSPFSIGMDNGANASGNQRRMINGTNYLNYGLYVDSAFTTAWTTSASSTSCTTTGQCQTATGTGAAQPFTIYGKVPAVGIAPASGAYSDTVTMTVTY